jgi:hypothetical protein
MIDPARLALEHRLGTPPPTAELLGTLATPEGGTVIAAFGRGRTVLCWWPRWPTLGQRRAFHRLHGFAPIPPRRRRRARTPRRAAA